MKPNNEPRDWSHYEVANAVLDIVEDPTTGLSDHQKRVLAVAYRRLVRLGDIQAIADRH